MKKIKHFVKTKKILSLIILLAILGVGYYTYSKSTSTSGQISYVVEKAKIANIETVISGTGQVYAKNQVEIKSKASGDITFLNTEANGKFVKKGTLIAKIDTRDAEISLQSAKISYAKLIEPADESTLLQAQNSLDNAIQNNSKSYSDGFNTIVNTFINLPTIMNGMYDMLYSRNGFLQTENVRPIGQIALDLQSKTGISFDKTKNHYDKLLIEYKNLSNTSSLSAIESFVSESYILAKEVSEVVKNAQNTINYVTNIRSDSAGTTAENSVISWTNTINSDVTSLLNTKNTIFNSTQTVIQQKANLSKITQGATDLDIASQKLQLQQANNTYENYFIRAPFDGVLARLLVKSTDTLSNGTSIGTIVSAEKIATITLNEVDVAKVRVGQKVKLSFDAIDDLTIDGTVITVDSVGTVTQGIVNYNVEISLDSLDDRIKSGMSTSANIIVDTRENVLTVSNSAVKTQGKFSYVEIFNPPLTANKGMSGIPSETPPTQKRVEVGVSNDTLTEIISGVSENDQVVTRVISDTKTTKVTSTGILGGSGTGVRFPRN